MVDIVWASTPIVPPSPEVSAWYKVILPSQTLYGSAPPEMAVTGVFENLAGWWSPPPSTGTVTQRTYGHGGIPGPAFYEPRVMVLEGSLHGDDPVMVRDAFEAYLGGLSINDVFPVVVDEQGLIRHTFARLEENPELTWHGGPASTFNIQLVAPDYRRLSGDGSGPTYSVTTGLPAQFGGLVFPAVFPATFDAVVVTGVVEVTNKGTATPPVSLRIQGPVSRPRVSTVDGQTMWFDLDLTGGQWLDVDLDARTVMLNGQASRRGALRGSWLDVGRGSTLRFDAAVYDAAARLTVEWFDAWK